VDHRTRLWQDRSIFQLRADRQAAALVAVFRALDEHRPLHGGEIEALALHRFLSGQDEDVLSDVLGDPYARVWTRLAFALCGSVLRGDGVPAAARALAEELDSQDARALLRAHLEQYKRLALAAALRADAKLEFTTPLVLALPFAIPAAGASLTGPPVARILGVADGQLLVDGDETRLEACPRACVGGWSVPLQRDGWRVPGLGWAPPASGTSHAFQESHRELVETGLALIARHQPDVFDQMREGIRWIAVNPISDDNPLNYVSYSELPGAFAFQGIPHAYSVAESSVHEFHHDRLFCLEECEPILMGESLGTEDHAGYYSPWRENLRPLRGVLHGAYVTAAQLRFWLAVAKAPDTKGTLADFVMAQLIRQPVVIDLALGQLERHARLTSEGARLVAQLRADLAAMAAEAGSLGVPWDAETMAMSFDGGFEPYRGDDGAPVSVRESIARHAREYDLHRQIPMNWLEANAPRPR
jgi:HEXXH motif-containing protein